jgi:hypothetical protein
VHLGAVNREFVRKSVFFFQCRSFENEELEMRKQRSLEHLSMMLKAIGFVVTAVIVLSSGVSGQEQEGGSNVESNDILGIGDPVLEKLLQNINKFKAGLEAVRTPIRQELEKRTQEAQKSGVLRKLEEATKDAEAFEKGDKLPATLMATKPDLMKQFRKGKEQVQQQMVNDFKTAIKEYTRLNKAAEAKATEERMEEFRASLRAPPPPRQRRRRR